MDFRKKLEDIKERQIQGTFDVLKEFAEVSEKISDAFSARAQLFMDEGRDPSELTYEMMQEEFGEIFIEHAGPLMVLYKRHKDLVALQKHYDGIIGSN